MIMNKKRIKIKMNKKKLITVRIIRYYCDKMEDYDWELDRGM